jgi:hypothetical protein
MRCQHAVWPFPVAPHRLPASLGGVRRLCLQRA